MTLVVGVSRAPVDGCKEVLMRETSRSTTDRPSDEARLQAWVSANMTGPRGHVAFITRTWSAGNRAGGEADLKWAALVNKLITCPEASASGSETFIQLSYADCCFGLLPKADSRSRETMLHFLLWHQQEPVFPSRSLAVIRLHLVPQLDVSVAALVIVSTLITAPPPALRAASPGLLSPDRSARLMEPLTSPLTLNCAG